VQIVVAGNLPREAHNAPLHLFSASPELLGFGSATYQQRSQSTSLLLRQLFKKMAGGSAMYTMDDFVRDYFTKTFEKMTPAEREDFLQKLPLKTRMAGASAEQIQEYLDQLKANRKTEPRKPRRKR
jgi:hypothetical protein